VELDWTTFLLEVINFLILVWVLKRFLYQPILNVIEKRRQKIEADMDQAAAGQEEAKALKNQYETRLVDWEQEKRSAFDALEQQLAQERSNKLRQCDDELEQHRLKHQARDQQQQTLWRSQAEVEALRLASGFAARLLTGLTGPELDMRLQQLFIEQLALLPEDSLRQLREGWQDSDSSVDVLSAMPLDSARQRAIRQALELKLGASDGHWQFIQDESLIAGLRVSIGGWTLDANLHDELRFFAEAAHGG
jgi:F-type H+-transporting ATPase subunit b